MPCYIYKHPKKEKYIELIQSMSEPHTYFDDKGIEWERVWTVPQAKVPLNIDINNPKDFAFKTKHTKGNLGDLFDRSKELGDKRASQNDDNGRDPIKDKFFDQWSAKRHGKKHTEDDRPQKKKKKNG